MRVRVGIIGGGLSGTLVAIKLLQVFKDDLEVSIFERSPVQVFRGVAYSSSLTFQPLNVRASHMNLWHDRPGDFYDWLEEHWPRYFVEKPKSTDFVARHVFGDYVQQRFLDAMRLPVDHQIIDLVFEEALAIEQRASGLAIRSASTEKMVDYVVLAMGNFLPADLPIVNPGFYGTPFYVANPWNGTWMNELQPKDPVLILGSGLTAVDQIINLLNTSHCGKIYISSRRGLLPQRHADYRYEEIAPFNISSDLTVLDLWKTVRKLVDGAIAQGKDWRNIIDSLRNQVPYIWAALPMEERRKFLRHVRPYWETHRHRIPEDSYDVIKKSLDEGRIEVVAGRVTNFEANHYSAQATIKLRGSNVERKLHVNKIVNCTGPQTDYRKIDQPLIQSLAKAGQLKPDPLNLGIAVNEGGQLINEIGDAVENIFAIGSLRKSAMWECTALREIALQADEFVDKLKSTFSS